MRRITILACVISLFFLLQVAKSDEVQDRNTLLEFFSKLSNGSDGNIISDAASGWNTSSYPCRDNWHGITCLNGQPLEIILRGLNLSGALDPKVLCNEQPLSGSLLQIDVTDNSVHGENLEYIANCTQLSHLHLGFNQFTGSFPSSSSQMKRLKSVDLSHNEFSGPLPDLSQVSDLTVFTVEYNQFSGPIPSFPFPSLSDFNVSYNNLTGSIPDGARRFKESSFIQNPELCGAPLPNNCSSVENSQESEPPPPPTDKVVHKRHSNYQILIYAGYILIGLAVLIVIVIWIYKRSKAKEERKESSDNKVSYVDDSRISKPSFSTVELKQQNMSNADVSTASADNSMASTSLIVLTSPEVNGLRFDELLKAPAELLGRGKHGSLYKVVAGGTTVAVKRIKDWTISGNEFKQRMRTLDLVKHPNVLSALAFYSSRQEKLLVYEYQQNGSLFKMIHSHGNSDGQRFDWSSRLSVAAKVSDAIAFMHEELQNDRIPHGNLKSSNILLNDNMEPCISEYGLMVEPNATASPYNALQESQGSPNSLFKADTYAFGVILLEMLTGRMRLNEGLDLASWVVAVVREEWTVEVFDRNLVREGASEERMVNMLQVAIKCVNKSPEARPTMRQVAAMVRGILQDDDSSMDASGFSTMTRSNHGWEEQYSDEVARCF